MAAGMVISDYWENGTQSSQPFLLRRLIRHEPGASRYCEVAGIAYEFARRFDLSMSRGHPLPQQCDAVHVYLMRTREAIVDVSERCPDGTSVTAKVLTQRIPHTVDFRVWPLLGHHALRHAGEVTKVANYYLSVDTLAAQSPPETKP